MKIYISLLACLLSGLLALQAQQVEVSYEVQDQQVKIWLQSSDQQARVLHAINLSLAHEAEVKVSEVKHSLFESSWTTYLMEEHQLKDLDLSYDGQEYGQRFQYGNAEPGLPTSHPIVIPSKDEEPLLAMVLQLEGSDQPQVYLEHQQENRLNQLGGPQIQPIDYVILHPQRGTNLEEDLGQELDLVLFPNPAKDRITLRLQGERNKVWTYTVADLLGRELLKGDIPTDLPNNELTLQLQNWAEGTYYVSLKDEQGDNIVRKFVKQ